MFQEGEEDSGEYFYDDEDDQAIDDSQRLTSTAEALAAAGIAVGVGEMARYHYLMLELHVFFFG